MNKKIFSLFVVLIFIVMMTITVLTIDASSTCSNGSQTCSGECCASTEEGCIAGPCDVIFLGQ